MSFPWHLHAGIMLHTLADSHPAVRCQVQALRSIEKYLQLDKLYVLGVRTAGHTWCTWCLTAVQSAQCCESALTWRMCLQTNCVDNGPRKGLETFLKAASDDPDTVLHYEFMQVSCYLRRIIYRRS